MDIILVKKAKSSLFYKEMRLIGLKSGRKEKAKKNVSINCWFLRDFLLKIKFLLSTSIAVFHGLIRRFLWIPRVAIGRFGKQLSEIGNGSTQSKEAGNIKNHEWNIPPKHSFFF